MIKISSRSLDDLEFPVVCSQVSELCITGQGKEKALKIEPYPSFQKTVFGLDQTNEFIKSKTQDEAIPNHGFDSIQPELRLLAIEESVLEIGGFRKISSLHQSGNLLDVGGGNGEFAAFMALQGWNVFIQDKISKLDNLSDIISFGVAPSLLIYYWSLK